MAALAAPIVQPTSVTATEVPAASALPEAVKTMEVLPGAAGTRVAAAADDFAVGVGEAAKKPDGCDGDAALDDAIEFERGKEMTELHFSAMQPPAHDIDRTNVKFFPVSIS